MCKHHITLTRPPLVWLWKLSNIECIVSVNMASMGKPRKHRHTCFFEIFFSEGAAIDLGAVECCSRSLEDPLFIWLHGSGCKRLTLCQLGVYASQSWIQKHVPKISRWVVSTNELNKNFDRGGCVQQRNNGKPFYFLGAQ